MGYYAKLEVKKGPPLEIICEGTARMVVHTRVPDFSTPNMKEYDIDVYVQSGGKEIEMDPNSMQDVDLRSEHVRMSIVDKLCSAISYNHKRLDEDQKTRVLEALREHSGLEKQIKMDPLRESTGPTAGSGNYSNQPKGG